MKNFLFLFIALIFFSGTRMSYISESEIQINKYISDYAKKLKKDGITLIGVGGSEIDGKCSLIDLQFEIDQILDFELGRKLIVFYVYDFLNYLNNKAEISEYFVEFPITNQLLIFSLFGKRIHRDGDNKTVFFDIVKFRKGEVSYIIDSHLKPLKLIKIENFEEIANELHKKFDKDHG